MMKFIAFFGFLSQGSLSNELLLDNYCGFLPCFREDELSKLSTDLEKQPKVASRKSYIERIKEITKNSRKQDADIERILKDTRELQLESNSIQERLHRTYAVVDEMVFRYNLIISTPLAYKLFVSLKSDIDHDALFILFVNCGHNFFFFWGRT